MRRIKNTLNMLLVLTCLGIFSLIPERYAAEASEDWPLGNMSLRTPTPDLSGLNHVPAGVLGRVEARGGQLVFADGTPARFWGANLQAYALFQTEPQFIKAHAKRIAGLGFNLVRIHHHDSHWVQPNVFGKNAADTRTLDANSMRKLDQWIAALKSQGVYIWLDLHVGRRFTAQDRVPDFNEIASDEGHADIQGFNYISPEIERQMLDFQNAYLGHRNGLTNLTYAEDPAVIAVMLTNENDLTHHFGNRLLPDKNVPKHNQTYMSLAREFAHSKSLDPDATWRSWEHGPSKIFLSDLEKRFNERMIRAVWDVGFDGLISTTSLWGGMTIAGLPSLTVGSIIDAHSYGTEGDTKFDPRERASFLDWLAIAQVADMPLSVSEWNFGDFPTEDRFVAPLRLAARAAHQGWDALMIYGYSQQPLNGPLRPSNWSMAEDPALMSMMPAAALLFREGHVRLADHSYAVCLNESDFFDRPVSPGTSIGIRTIVEQSRLVICMPETPALPWLQPTELDGAQFEMLKLDRSYLPDGATEVRADTGEFHRNFARGQFIVDTGQTQGVAGSFHDEVIETTDVVFDIATPMAAVAVQSLDRRAIADSHHILISVSGRAVPAGAGAINYRIEPVAGQLRINARSGLALHAPPPAPTLPSDAHRIEGDVHVIDLSKLRGLHWIYLQ